MRKCANFLPYMRRPLVIYDFAPDPLNFLLYEENFISFLSVYEYIPLYLFTQGRGERGGK
jgi:hypothetical protein